jgi:Lon protease-like protein
MARLPVFPLGTVLLPSAVLPLHIFEPRYRVLVSELTGRGDPSGGEMGVVLISRGSEVGGGDERVRTGTVARLLEADELPDGRWLVSVAGTRRFRVDAWLPDAPYPVAEVSDLDGGAVWDDGDDALLDEAERRVRHALGLAAEVGVAASPATFSRSDDPFVAAWQLAAAVPVGPFDRQRLLETDDVSARLRRTRDLADDAAEVLALRLGGAQ